MNNNTVTGALLLLVFNILLEVAKETWDSVRCGGGWKGVSERRCHLSSGSLNFGLNIGIDVEESLLRIVHETTNANNPAPLKGNILGHEVMLVDSDVNRLTQKTFLVSSEVKEFPLFFRESCYIHTPHLSRDILPFRIRINGRGIEG